MKEIRLPRPATVISLGFALAMLLFATLLQAQNAPVSDAPPPSSGGIFPLSQVHRGLVAVAWTVFQGSQPEPMNVEILGVLRGARGPGQDMILAQLKGAKPEYTGVVEGMSGSPVYVGNKLLGSLSYRIGQFSKDPIAGITPIEQMLQVRDLPVEGAQTISASGNATLSPLTPASVDKKQSSLAASQSVGGMSFQAMETPLVMSGFGPEAIRLWQQQMAGTGLEMVAGGGMAGSSKSASSTAGSSDEPSAAAWAHMVPGSAVSAQLVRGDLEIAATCTVTYIDPKQLLACGHPILQAGPVSLPMTTAEVVATLASPLNAFQIITTGELIGACTDDRDSAIRGVLGARPRMIPVHITVHDPDRERKLNIEIIDLPSLTPQAVIVSLYQALLQANDSSFENSYHLTGSILLDGYPASPIDLWASSGDQSPAAMMIAFGAGERFTRLYSNGAREGAVREINLRAEAIPHRVQVDLETARLVSNDIVHAGDTIMVEATVRPWQQPARNVRIPVTLPARLGAGTLRLLISDSGTLDRTLDQPRISGHPVDMKTVLAQASRLHAADRVYVSLLVPESQAGMEGQTLGSVPLSMANALEPVRTAQDVVLNGESAELAAQAPAGGVLSGFQVLNVRIEPGGGLN